MNLSRVSFPRAGALRFTPALALALALAAWAVPAAAQQTEEARESQESRMRPGPMDQRIVEVKHADPSALARVL
ncbi:MAG TPA: hypothetical protein VLF66_01160, partial [Thermoanaerobaculia bacterium]|nr:hypothetical protein [Thermoanaerobaculia bacterium]